jgi:transcription elongation factor Elf1
MNCPKCGSVATNITPVRGQTSVQVFGCSVCGHAFDGSGAPIVNNTKQLADVFRAATEGQKTLQEVFGVDKMDPATKAVLTTKLLEYGVQMWFDGVKQGILLTTIKEMKDGNGKSGSEPGSVI